MAEKKQLRPSGLWPSLITPEMTGKLLEFSELIWNESGCLYWKERTSNQSGIIRYCQDQDNPEYLTPEINVGGGIGYGGGSFTVEGNTVLLVEKNSNQLFLISNEKKQPKKLLDRCLKLQPPGYILRGNTWLLSTQMAPPILLK